MATRILTVIGGALAAVFMFLGWSDAARTAAAMDDSLPAVGPELTFVPPKDLKDVPLAADPALSEGQPRVVANPKNPSLLVLVLNDGNGRCLAYRSSNAGRSWSAPVPLPDEPSKPGGRCFRADVAYAPGGKRVYAAYGVASGDNYPGILVSGSDDNGTTWQRPVVVFEGTSSVGYAPQRIATPLGGADDEWVYLVADRSPEIGPVTWTEFTRSADRGTTWSAPVVLASSIEGSIGGGSLAGGRGGEILVAWANNNNATIEIVRSRNHGAAFAPRTIAATDAVAYGFGPDIKIGDNGAAHVVYDRVAPLPGDTGDIGYVWSPGPPYTTWSKPVTVNHDGSARSQFSPSLATQRCGASTILHVIWEDTRLSPSDTYSYWDVFYARKVGKPGAGWSKNIRVSDKSSYYGVFIGGTAVSRGRVFAAWNDRRDKTDPQDYETDVYGSGILSGVTCP